MITDVKDKARRTTAFVQRHKTAVACAATAVATAAVVNSHHVNARYQFAFEQGQRVAELDLYVDSAYAFIESKNLTTEFIEDFCQGNTV